MAVPARISRSSADVPPRVSRAAGDVVRLPTGGREGSSLPLRDWKRAFALVDALKAAYRGAAWFGGVRAFREPGTGDIRIEVEVSDGDAPSRLLPERLLALGVRFRRVAPAASPAF